MNILYNDFYKLSRSLADHEDVSRTKFNGNTVDANEVAFLYYPEVRYVRHPFHGYARCRRYFWYHKRGQRKVLSDYVNIPSRAEDGEPPYVVRPIRHFGGRGFYIAEDEQELQEARNQIDGRSYAVEVFRRTREFRAFFVKGENTTTMLKSLEGYGYAEAENMPDPDNDELQLKPWNRDQMESTRYLTITREVNDKLQTNTDFYDHVSEFLDQYPFDLLAFDVAYNDHNDEYAVFETNFAPQCTITATLRPMRQAMLNMDRFS